MTSGGRVYLDHAATTPMVPEAIEAMQRELGRVGNASSLHASGRAARRVVEEARESIAARVGAEPAEVIFTSGGTESDNLAVKGGYWSQAARGRTAVVTSQVEHHAVLDAVAWLAAAAGATARLLPVDADARIDPAALAEAVDDDTALVSVIWANNEVGTIQPVEQVAALARARGAWSHSDAVQAVGHLPVDFAASGLDLLSFTAHKLGGPYGVGVLLARREVGLTPIQHGGGQERDVRSGTFDVAAVAGFAAALEVAVRDREAERQRVAALRDRLVDGVLRAIPDARKNGPADPDQGLPGVANIAFPGCLADSLLMLLDAADIDCSTGSACSAGVSQPSHVLIAIGETPEDARSSLRFSLGHTSTEADVTALLSALPEAVRSARTASAYT
jgi:cysteine desulfurase